jgi:hypothetical protein
MVTPSSPAAFSIPASRLLMALWLFDDTPIFLPRWIISTITRLDV